MRGDRAERSATETKVKRKVEGVARLGRPAFGCSSQRGLVGIAFLTLGAARRGIDMYLFSRSTRIGSPEGLAWAVTMTEHAKRASGLDIGLWGQVWSPEFGRITWTGFVPDLATLAAAGDKMNADAKMAADAAKGAEHTTGGIDDALYNIVHGDLDPNAPQAEYVTSVAAVCASGQLAKAMAAGVDIAQRAEKITGAPTMFASNVTGVYGGVGWLTGFETIEALEAANQAMATDADWVMEVDKVGSVFSSDAGATTQLIYRRFA